MSDTTNAESVRAALVERWERQGWGRHTARALADEAVEVMQAVAHAQIGGNDE